jgi:hypothetical protein
MVALATEHLIAFMAHRIIIIVPRHDGVRQRFSPEHFCKFPAQNDFFPFLIGKCQCLSGLLSKEPIRWTDD